VGGPDLNGPDLDQPVRRPAVVLLSGGLDSATCLAVARAEGLDVVALSFDYGQRHDVELRAARQLAEAAGVEHVVCRIDLRAFGGSALTAEIDVPKHDGSSSSPSPSGRSGGEDGESEIPVTYVPARNTIFLSFALALAEVRGADQIFIGVNAVDYSGYPDCRPEFIAAFQTLADLATRVGVEGGPRMTIRTPLIERSKAEIVQLGTELGVDYAATISCYDPDAEGRACRSCDACVLRARGFADAGLDDPTSYQPS
jgi:7-cyano-7-deazaguanine synthase